MDHLDIEEFASPLKWIVAFFILAELSICWAVFTPMWALILGVTAVSVTIGLVALLPVHWRA